MPAFIEIANIVPRRPRILNVKEYYKQKLLNCNKWAWDQFIIIIYLVYLSSASSETNKTTKLTEPPAANPVKNLPKHTSVTFDENIFNSHANY